MITTRNILTNLEETPSVDFVGLHELDIDDYAVSSIKDIAEQSLEKIKDIIQQDAILKVHIKRKFAGHGAKQYQYSVVLHFEYAHHSLSIDNVHDWELEKAVYRAVKELESRISRIDKTARYPIKSYAQW